MGRQLESMGERCSFRRSVGVVFAIVAVWFSGNCAIGVRFPAGTELDQAMYNRELYCIRWRWQVGGPLLRKTLGGMRAIL